MAIDEDIREEDWGAIRDELEEVLKADEAETERRGRVSIWHTPQKSPNRPAYQAAQELKRLRPTPTSTRSQTALPS